MYLDYYNKKEQQLTKQEAHMGHSAHLSCLLYREKQKFGIYNGHYRKVWTKVNLCHLPITIELLKIHQ